MKTYPEILDLSISPCFRLKVNIKGLITKYWSVECNNQEHYRINTSQQRVNLRHSSGMSASAVSVSLDTPTNYPSIPLPQFTPSLLNSITHAFEFKQRDSRLIKPAVNPLIAIEMDKPVSIERSIVNRFILTESETRATGLFIRDVPGHYKWRAWHIFDCRSPSKVLVQFIWFGNVPGKKTIGGIELFAQLPESYVTAILIVIMAYFNECEKAETPTRTATRTFFPRGLTRDPSKGTPNHVGPTEPKEQKYDFLVAGP